MKNLSYILVFAIATVFAMTSCKNEAGNAVNAVKEAAPQIVKSEGLKVNVPAGPLTTVEAVGEVKYDFGTVEEGAVVEHTFKLKNTGSEPLVIKSAKSTCGCTVPEKPEGPIAPGEVADIKVKFNTKGKGKRTGGTQLNKKPVTITANTAEPFKFYIEGLVNKPASAVKETSHAGHSH